MVSEIKARVLIVPVLVKLFLRRQLIRPKLNFPLVAICSLILSLVHSIGSFSYRVLKSNYSVEGKVSPRQEVSVLSVYQSVVVSQQKSVGKQSVRRREKSVLCPLNYPSSLSELLKTLRPRANLYTYRRPMLSQNHT